MIKITVNGSDRSVDDGTTVAQLAHDCGVSEKGGAAIAIDDKLIPRADWRGTVLEQGADVLIIKAAYGG